MEIPKISVIITTYRRFKNLKRIYLAWLKQPVEEVWILNGNKDVNLDYGDHSKGIIFNMPKDFGTKMDYVFALLTIGDYIILADDDVLPKEGFVEDLFRGWKKVGGGIVGVIGRKFIVGKRYGKSHFYRASKITKPMRVDFCGIIYFAPRKYFGFDVRGMPRNCDDLWWHLKVFPDVPKHVVPSKKYIDLPECRDNTAMWTNPKLRAQRRDFFKQYFVKKAEKMKDLSNRTDILFALIKEFIQPEFTFLDVGCGFSPLYLGTDLANEIWVNFPKAAYCGLDTIEKVIEYCKKSHPQYEWICIQAEKFKIEKKYNFVIHTGIDKLWSDGWQIHENLIASEFAPDYIFLEVGGESGHKNESQEIYDNLISKYQAASYHQIQTGTYFWNLKGIKAPWRQFVVLERINC